MPIGTLRGTSLNELERHTKGQLLECYLEHHKTRPPLPTHYHYRGSRVGRVGFLFSVAPDLKE